MKDLQMVRIYIGADHGGLAYKAALVPFLTELGYQVTDCGAATLDPLDDYPDFARLVAVAVAQEHAAFGILLCRTGAGMCIAANKVPGVRAVCTTTQETTRLSRQHNHANVLALGADELSIEQAKELVRIFITTDSSDEVRHVRRVQKIQSIEN